MGIVLIKSANNHNEYMGLSTDEWPEDNVPMNSIFLELDTGELYYYSGTEWAIVGGTPQVAPQVEETIVDNGPTVTL